MTISQPYDLAVVGGGPAGVAGALTAALRGLRVVLVDSGVRLGGQYFRHRSEPDLPRGFARQVRALTERADVLLGHQVWAVTREDGGFTVRRTGAAALRSERLLIATGAHDRALPFPGWDLPGVLTAGGAQALLKGHGVVAGRRVVVAGTGPFLLPVAAGLAAAGAAVPGVYEAGGGLGLARHPLPALARAGEAAGYLAALARHRVPYRTRHAVVAAHGDRELEAVTVARLDRDWNVLSTRRVRCDALATGYGFVPQIELGVQLGCATRPDLDGTPVLTVDAAQRTSVPGVWAAGEPTGVGGRHLSETEGRIAGLSIAATRRTTTPPRPLSPIRAAPERAAAPQGPAIDATSADTASAVASEGAAVSERVAGSDGAAVSGGAARPGGAAGPDGAVTSGAGAEAFSRRAVVAVLLRRRRRMRAFAAALLEAYPVKDGWQGWLRDDTVVCRCEEVPLGRIREARELGATDARSAKLLSRAGMGWCQGRICGYPVACLIGGGQPAPRRPIAQPITLAALADLTEPDPAAVDPGRGGPGVPDSAAADRGVSEFDVEEPRD